MAYDQKWDYPQMALCAEKLDTLCEAAGKNKKLMDDAMETLTAGVQAEVGKAFVAAYSEHVASIQMFAQALNGESELLRNNSNNMQAADEEIAAQIRQTFMV